MAKLIAAIDVSNIDPTQGGAGGFPVGTHRVVNIKNEVKTTKGGDGGMVVFETKIIEGPHAGTVGAIRLNLYNPNQQAVEIALKQLSAMAHCIGYAGVITDLDVLNEKPYSIEVGLQKGEEAAKKGYTEVKRFFDYNGNEPMPGGNQPQSNNGNQSGFGGQQQQPQTNQQGNQGGFGVSNNVQMPQENQQQPQNQQPQNNGQPSGGQSWGGAGGQQQPQNGQPQGNGSTWGAGAGGAATGAGAAGGGWGQQRS